jgi:hypothetical protein
MPDRIEAAYNLGSECLFFAAQVKEKMAKSAFPDYQFAPTFLDGHQILISRNYFRSLGPRRRFL